MTRQIVAKARAVRPLLTGINSRDLTTFEVDTTLPARLRPAVDWPTTLLFESGIHCAEDAAFARAAGFDGVLVGEAVVRRPQLVAELREVLSGRTLPEGGRRPFWERVFAARRARHGGQRPLVKVCGITTNRQDAETAVELGADLLGFILAPSPRRARPEVIAELADLPVHQGRGGGERHRHRACRLLEEGLLDAVQLHGDERPEECYGLAFPYYKALQVGAPEDLERERGYRCPRVLLDAFSAAVRGGSGRRVDGGLLQRRAAAQPASPLRCGWRAASVPHNVAAIVGGAPARAGRRLHRPGSRTRDARTRTNYGRFSAICPRTATTPRSTAR